MNENLLGEYISAKRNELGLSLRAAAEKAELSPSQLSKIERGVVKTPGEDTLKKIAYTLNEDPGDIMLLAGRLFEEETARVVAQYFPGLVGKNVSELRMYDSVLARMYSEPEDSYSVKKPFSQLIREAVVIDSPELSSEDVEQVVKEMIAARDLTMMRLANKKVR
ncbi:helix-turn-helix domain-containing protein [Paenibacillus odorifer]|uniref:helix-turn-helix domain-containing protein n=1 Tax=Paenibacillus odorifer TaxID=189426 RepID=UPI00096E2FAD|nr:helix-turn-helix transcriptional regulator [Paenibacillus odorifer]OMD16255.1 hypothetical protein BJP50_18635 [Paenibacillus odorifer]